MSAESTTFGKRLRALRERAGLSQNVLAQRSGVSQSLISKMEQGSTEDPKLTTLLALAKALGVTLNDFTAEGTP